MTIRAKPRADVAVDVALVRDLLGEQHADLADLPLTTSAEGWDNALFRLGDNLVVRLPRRAIAATLIEHEQRWLPELSQRLPLPVPVPLRVGRPGCGFPWAWSIVPWLPGASALHVPPDDPSAAGVVLGQFLRALHQAAPADAPRNSWRGVPLAAREPILLEHVRQLDHLIDRTAVISLWERVMAASPWSGPPVWIHGDLHPGNLLVDEGRLSSVIDFGDLAAGDPATDLSVAWVLLPSSARPTFRTAARGTADAIDADTWLRARGWALALGLAGLASSRDDEPMRALGRTTIDAALNDPS